MTRFCRWAAAAGLLVACATGGGGGGFDPDASSGGSGAAHTGGAPHTDAASGGLGAAGTGASGGFGATGGTGGTGGPATPDGGAPDSATDSSASDAADTGNPFGDCCSVHTAPGCSDGTIQQCVCAIDATCCSLGWNLGCVKVAATYQCAACPDGGIPGTGGTDGGTAGGDCCYSHSTSGCGNATVEACVCAIDSYCCSYGWDSICAGEVTSEGCGTC